MEQVQVTAVVFQVIRATNSKDAKSVMREIRKHLPGVKEEKILAAIKELYDKVD